MDYHRLIPTIVKLALDTEQVKPEEVYAVLQQKNQGKTEDKNTETVDGEVLDAENPSADDVANEEGKILESAFKELDIEDAIEQVKESKKYNDTANATPTINNEGNSISQKAASYWEVLRSKYGNHSR